MNADDRIRAAFAAEEPPARDLAFTAAVMERVARRRLWRSLLLLAAPLVAATAVLWAAAPALAPLAEDMLAALQPAIGMLVTALFLGLAGARILRPFRS